MGEERLCSRPSLQDRPGGCLSGCVCAPDWNGPTCVDGRPPSQLREVLSEHRNFAAFGNIYNEVVVDTASVVAGLPSTVEAFFYLRGGDRGAAQSAHANFLSQYGLGDGRQHGRSVPLLMLDFGNLDSPFSMDDW